MASATGVRRGMRVDTGLGRATGSEGDGYSVDERVLANQGVVGDLDPLDPDPAEEIVGSEPRPRP